MSVPFVLAFLALCWAKAWGNYNWKCGRALTDADIARLMPKRSHHKHKEYQ
jgi:hypothetical protein